MNGSPVPDDWSADEALAVVDLLLAIVNDIDRRHGAAMRRRERQLRCSPYDDRRHPRRRLPPDDSDSPI